MSQPSRDLVFVIDEQTCIECGCCRRYCPVPGAIIISADYQHTIIPDICTGCGICEAFCPVPNTIFAVERASVLSLIELARQPDLTFAQRQALDWLKARRHVVWRDKWLFQSHPVLGELTHKARTRLREGRFGVSNG